jgi:hypothetical protein
MQHAARQAWLGLPSHQPATGIPYELVPRTCTAVPVLDGMACMMLALR